MNRDNYKEIAKGKIADARNIIISKYSDNSYTMAQTLEVEEAGKMTTVFMKGAIHINNLDGLYNVRNALNLAIERIEKGEFDENVNWDDEEIPFN